MASKPGALTSNSTGPSAGTVAVSLAAMLVFPLSFLRSFGYAGIAVVALAGVGTAPLTGVAVMGVLSALIVGPCVAPPLAAGVLYISQTRDPLFGGGAIGSLAFDADELAPQHLADRARGAGSEERIEDHVPGL